MNGAISASAQTLTPLIDAYRRKCYDLDPLVNRPVSDDEDAVRDLRGVSCHLYPSRGSCIALRRLPSRPHNPSKPTQPKSHPRLGSVVRFAKPECLWP
jgi:hypothetical protein